LIGSERLVGIAERRREQAAEQSTARHGGSAGRCRRSSVVFTVEPDEACAHVEKRVLRDGDRGARLIVAEAVELYERERLAVHLDVDAHAERAQARLHALYFGVREALAEEDAIPFDERRRARAIDRVELRELPQRGLPNGFSACGSHVDVVLVRST